VGWTEAADGRSILELRVPVTPEVLTWPLTSGADAEVPGLRSGVRGVLERAAARYDNQEEEP
jgi:hypothetical protein